MEAIVEERILIKNYTQDAYKFFRDELTFENPEYFKRLNSGRWIGSTPKTLTLLTRSGDDLVLPFGMLPEVFKRRKAFDRIFNGFHDVKYKSYGSNIKPYAYQEKAILSALRARQGVIVAPCGAGKTQIGLEIAARIGGRTLWLTHTTDLLNQSITRAKACYSMLDEKDYGTITAGKIDIGRTITFATVQTMNRIDLNSIRDQFDVVIVDECHHVVGTPTQVMMFYHVVSGLAARYKFGLTATPKRADGLSACMFALIGPKVCEIEREELEQTTCPVKVRIQKTSFAPDFEYILNPDGTLSYPKFVTDVCGNEARNVQIINDIATAEGTCLVLTDRVAHAQLIAKRLEDLGVSAVAISAVGGSKADKEARNKILERLNDKEIKAVVATYALAKEGLDVPSLDNLFFATPQKNETIVTQAAGRVARRAEGKDFGTLYDYEDAFAMLQSWQKKRKSIYRKLGYIMLAQQDVQ